MNPGMRVLFFLPGIRAYRDRVETLMGVSDAVDKFILLVGKVDYPISSGNHSNFKVVDCNFRNGWGPVNSFKASRVATRLIKEESLDIVHDTFATLLPLILRRKKYPHVTFLTSLYIDLGWRVNYVWADIPMHRHLRSKTSLLLFKDRVAEKCILPRVDCTVVQAPVLVSRVCEFNRVRKENIAVITNTVNTDRWHLPETGPRRVYPYQPIRLLYAGTPGLTRGAAVMFEALKILGERSVAATLTIVGGPGWERFSGTFLESLLDQWNLRNRVERVGRLSSEELLKAFHSHHVLLYQTINDGSPRIVLEAMASGIPMIASHHPGIDVLDPDGKAIAFTEYGDAETIADLVEDYVSDHVPWLERAVEGRHIVEAKFSHIAGAKQYVELYERLAGR